MKQSSVDSAFRKPPRVSNNRASFGEWTICQLNGKRADHLGVVETFHPHHGVLRYTSLERTLVEIAARPFYSGGPAEVLRIYTAAARCYSAEALLTTLEEIDFAYPYRQSIGFYLERSGASAEVLDRFRAIPQEIDFYLDTQMESPAYSPDWHLYYPAELNL